MELTHKILLSKLNYNKYTGIFTWQDSASNAIKNGDIAGAKIQKNGYKIVSISGKSYYCHRLAWFYEYGLMPKQDIDHINHNRIDNRISNLREITRQENNKNLSMRTTNTSGVMGVYWVKSRQKWNVKIGINGKSINLGYYKLKEDAILVRKNAEDRYGFHINHGKN